MSPTGKFFPRTLYLPTAGAREVWNGTLPDGRAGIVLLRLDEDDGGYLACMSVNAQGWQTDLFVTINEPSVQVEAFGKDLPLHYRFRKDQMIEDFPFAARYARRDSQFGTDGVRDKPWKAQIRR